MLNFCSAFDAGPANGINGARAKSALIEVYYSPRLCCYFLATVKDKKSSDSKSFTEKQTIGHSERIT